MTHGGAWSSGAATPRRSTIVATGLLVCSSLPSTLVASLALSIRRDFPLSTTELGVAAGSLFAAGAAMAVVSEPIVRRMGIVRGVYTASGTVSLCSLAIAGVVDSAAGLILAMIVLGLGSGVGQPSLAALLARDVPEHRRGAAYGVFTAGPLIAVFLSGLALPLVAEPFGWRWAFVLLALAPPALAWALPRSGAEPLRAAPTGSSPSRRPIYLTATASGLASAAGLGMRSFLVVFAVAAGFAASEAGALLAAVGAVAIGSRLVAGRLGDRWPRETLGIAAGLMLVCGAGFLLMTPGEKPFIVAGAVMAGGIGWGWQAPLTHAAIDLSGGAPVAAVGIQLAGFYVGAIVGPVMVGILAESGHFVPAWILCGALVSAAAAVTLVARIDRARQGVPTPAS